MSSTRYLILAAVSLSLFLFFTLSVLLGWGTAFDTWALVWLHTLASPSLTHTAIILSLLGSGWVITPLAVGAYLGLRRAAPAEARWLFILVVGGLILFLAVVFLIDRPRPTLFNSPVSEPTASFPSGHAMNTTIVFLSLYLALTQLYLRWRHLFGCLGLVTLLVVSASRLYLQIHYPTDIIAGVALGVSWVMALYTLRASHNTPLPPRPAEL